MEHIVKDIIDKVSTKEPLYKITYAIPSLDIEDPDGDPSYNLDVEIKSVIYNFSTYKENYKGDDETLCQRSWDTLINEKIKTHTCIDLIEYEKYDENVYIKKISVELIN
jgi:hypothetical protein